MKKTIPRRARLLGLALSTVLITSLHAAGPVGINTGISSTANPQTVASGCGWVRVGAVLPSGHTTWDSYSLGQLDNMVNSAQSAGLQLILLLNGSGTWPGESGRNVNSGGNGTNAYITGFVNNAVTPIIQRVHDRVKIFEIWNEPSTSATYVEPSCYAQMLTSSWIAAHKTLGYSDVTIIAGDGGDGSWLGSVYAVGTTLPVNCFRSAKSLYGTYPVDGFAQHIYVDQLGGSTLASDYQNYYTTYHNYYANSTYEGTTTTKGMYITEFGFDTVYMLNHGIGTEAQAEQLQANNIDTALHALNPGTPGSFIKLAILYAWNDYPGAGFGITLADQTTHKTDYNYFKNDASFEGHTGMNNGNNNNNILSYFNGKGQAILGSPFDNGGGAFVHTYTSGGCSANIQDYNGGSDQKLTLIDSIMGTFSVNDTAGFWDAFSRAGFIGGLGYPTYNQVNVSYGSIQPFTKGIVYSDAAGTHSVIRHPVTGPVGYNAAGRLQVFAVGSTGPLFASGQTTASQEGWSGWQNLSGSWPGVNGKYWPVLSACGDNSDSRMQVFLVGTTGNLYTSYQTNLNGSVWSGYQDLGTGDNWTGAIPAVSYNTDGRMQVFVIGTTGKLYTYGQQNNSDPTHWATAQPLTLINNAMNARVAVAQNADGRMQAFIVDKTGTLYTSGQSQANGASWSSPVSLGNGFSQTALAAASELDGRIEVFAVNTNGWAISTSAQTAPNTGGWTSWYNLPGGTFTNSCPTVTYNADGRLQVFGINGGVLYSAMQNTTNQYSNWSSFTPLSGSWNKDVAAGQNQNGLIEIFAVGTDGAMHSTSQASANNNSWNSWYNLPSGNWP